MYVVIEIIELQILVLKSRPLFGGSCLPLKAPINLLSF